MQERVCRALSRLKLLLFPVVLPARLLALRHRFCFRSPSPPVCFRRPPPPIRLRRKPDPGAPSSRGGSFRQFHVPPLPLTTVVVWHNSGVALGALRVATGDLRDVALGYDTISRNWFALLGVLLCSRFEKAKPKAQIA
ncbi:uncharacterized protein LOC100843492 isoform X2 [Brachypodium distachyon]|uniref:Uncharacterized protein n=1 Tax=Brachypodium distachyon TaxID=15368 RepID=A0A2K2CMS2_BRADI|nr:uncharacterized protein LOC100843492 isoform X2 [Brachypodium distachyon]PNT63335.1 hypothetical protein BRADI_4g14387v3 [Brachypodium distachyon]|eukprot:XP_024319374.1 uncharacterized protein LOC100843492 isoform X2 [Brachypodium distachyon]